MWQPIDNHKFGLVAVQNCDAEVTDGRVFDNGTIVLTSITGWINEQWRRWVGESRVEKLEDCNLIILRHAPSKKPGDLDEEHRQLSLEANLLFRLLAFQDVPHYESAWSVRGSFLPDYRQIRQMGEVPEFFRTEGCSRREITDTRLAEADAALPQWLAVSRSGEFHRFRLGVGVLLDGLRNRYGEERIHQYARALEALILPDVGSTERQFVHRCLTFTGASEPNRSVLRESFRMRSDTEHLHTWNRSLSQTHPSDQCESLALRRTRQMEKLASFAILHVLTSPDLRNHFRNDASTAEFWALRDDERAALWGETLDISVVP